MSGYIIEEPGDCPIYMNIENNTSIEQYWAFYSKHQRKRHQQTMRQLDRTWFEVIKSIHLVRKYAPIEQCNHIMKNMYKMFFAELRVQIGYYLEEKIKYRKQTNFIQSKINKIRNKKYTI